MGIAIAVDLVLVLTGRKSISMATWITAQQHPTLIAAGILGTVWLCSALAAQGAHWSYVMFAAMMGGHLFTGIPVNEQN